MIQSVISRLANNSYAYKGWTITVAAGLVAFLAEKHSNILLSALYPILAFWFLDAHSLALERAFRRLYDNAREGNTPNYSMNISEVRRPIIDQMSAMSSSALLLFYGSATVFILLIVKAIK
jgi:hypothetical protein